MKMNGKRLLIVILTAFIFALAACGDTKDEEKTAKESEKTEEALGDNTEQENQTEGEVVEEEEESEDVSFEVDDSTAPEDQGDLAVWFEGDFKVEGNKILLSGKTNLLPESQLALNTDSVDGIIIGGNGFGKVEGTGDFELEAGVPDDFKGVLHIELSFESGNQAEEITEHYSEGITGNFARVYYDSYEDEVLSKATFHKTIVFDGEEQTFAIEAPEWNIPDDLGDANVWINPSVEKFEDYVVINIESNLVEETFIRATGSIPNYITTGFNGTAYTNPDGSATIYIKDPEKDDRIKDLEKYDIKLEVDPADGNNGKQVKEAYGEMGDKLLGDLVVEQGEGKAINQKITITAE
ncbi:hypothetical protein [Paucisalibacillus sp. EB02]|uniref:hypothetical protein n=1 Tax=Paucisalibacillus sp. EB02 TaxID=1347087 RepID=UPI0004B261A3|nr:hypothetical protein [Paucisalibacillus sp. EB02]